MNRQLGETTGHISFDTTAATEPHADMQVSACFYVLIVITGFYIFSNTDYSMIVCEWYY